MNKILCKSCTNLFIIFYLALPQYYCVQKHNPKKNISEKYTKWLEPFTKRDTVVYSSENNLRHTIIFFSALSSSARTNNFEQGFYKTYSLNVSYQLSQKSFHQIINPNSSYPTKDLISINQSFDLTDQNDNPEPGIGFSFLGLLFNEEYVIKITSTNSVALEEKNAKYKNLNINHGIKSFQFDFSKGIISFIDNDNLK